MRVHLSRPDVTEREIAVLETVIRSPVLAMGPYIAEFERAVAGYVGRKHGIACNSGTSGLHLLVRALGIGDGDEVITTPFSFIASSNCILYERARPVFVDIELDTGNIDPGLMEAAITPRTKAILAVDAFGQPARLDEIRAIADRHGLFVIEDSCESLGSEYKGTRTGNGAFAHGAVFAFYPNKQITTGEGGMVVTDDDDIARLCRSLCNQGRGDTGAWLSHERLGFNYRMDEMSAALGVTQMKRIDEIIQKRARVAAMYNKRLSEVDGVVLPRISPDVTAISWFVYVIRVGFGECKAERQAAIRDHVLHFLLDREIGCRPYFTPIHLQPFYRQLFGYMEGDFPIAELLGRTSIAIPFHNNLTEKEIDFVAETLAEALRCVPRCTT